uniref:hypothetical protein n=1 Tax=Prevotella sp. TaxID=59823 RepID=UPI003FEF09BB
MIHFLEQHFVELVTITSIIYLTLATILLLCQTPDTAVYKTFRRSKRLMAGGMVLISLNIWIWIASFTGSWTEYNLSLINIKEPTRRTPISYEVFCMKKKVREGGGGG